MDRQTVRQVILDILADRISDNVSESHKIYIVYINYVYYIYFIVAATCQGSVERLGILCQALFPKMGLYIHRHALLFEDSQIDQLEADGTSCPKNYSNQTTYNLIPNSCHHISSVPTWCCIAS